MKTLALLLLLAAPLYAADSTKTDVCYGYGFDVYGNPVDADGDPLDPGKLKIAIERATFQEGWKFNLYEWEMLKNGYIARPGRYIDPIRGDNEGLTNA